MLGSKRSRLFRILAISLQCPLSYPCHWGC